MLTFLLAIAAIAGAIVAIEESRADRSTIRRPVGLLGWIARGNWPAKIGGGLLVLGVGALIRYVMVNIDFPPAAKLAVGAVAAAVLGLASMAQSNAPGRRTLSLALAGAAFGVAYLTAYAAFALLGYATTPTGLALLSLTSIAAGVVAVQRNALSLALLAMVGAFLAPAFAVDDPGPRVAYGYYVAAAALTLFMVALRGWRPLIQLSFLFTLVGGVFFAWTAHYYTNGHYEALWPLLWLLVAMHVAMPLMERRHEQRSWIQWLDVAYLLTLPFVAGLLAAVIAPSAGELATLLVLLGVIWLVAAACLRILGRDGAAAHAAIATVLIGLGMAAEFRELPWELVAVAFAVGALALAARRGSPALCDLLCVLVLVFAALHVVDSLTSITSGEIFLNGRFLERVAGATLVLAAARVCRRAERPLGGLLLTVAVGWFTTAIAIEIGRWGVVSAWLAAHWLLIVLVLFVSAVRLDKRGLAMFANTISIAVVATAPFAATSASLAAAWIAVIAAPLSMLALALRRGEPGAPPDGRLAAAVLASIVAALWTARIGRLTGLDVVHVPLTAAGLTALLVVGAGRVFRGRGDRWMPVVTEVFGVGFAVTLAAVTLFDIERHPWAVTLELTCLGGLILLAWHAADRHDGGHWIGRACVVAAALVVQAHLLRWLGPTGHLTAADVTRMQWPTLVSLLWGALGAALTLWSRRTASRALWTGGAGLLAASAMKLIVFDFGSLGDLANIVAVIIAGGVFLLVGWLAPMPPPAAIASPAPAAKSPPGAQSSSRSSIGTAPTVPGGTALRVRWVLVLAFVIVGVVVAARLGPPLLAVTLQMAADSARTPKTARRTAPTAPVAPAESECMQWVARLPRRYEVHVAGAYGGRELDFALGGDVATAYEVSVHRPRRNVVLVLGSYEPGIWSIRWSPKTDVVGVWVSGYGPQEVIGLDPDTPVLRTIAQERSTCPSFYLTETDNSRAVEIVDSVLGKEIRSLVLASDGRANVGDAGGAVHFEQAEHRSPEEFRDTSLPLARDKGIKGLLTEGKLRPATSADIARAGEPIDNRPLPFDKRRLDTPRTYVIVQPMTFPAGLHGAHSVTFLLAPGVPYPAGNPGHSRVLAMGI